MLQMMMSPVNQMTCTKHVSQFNMFSVDAMENSQRKCRLQASSNGGACATSGTLKPHKNKENKRKFWQIWHIVAQFGLFN